MRLGHDEGPAVIARRFHLGQGASFRGTTEGSVLLLHPPGQQYTSPPLGLLYLAAQLRECGVTVTVLDASVEELSLGGTLERIDALRPRPRVIGLPTWTANWADTRKMTFILKERHPEALLVLGGPHATALPEDTLCSSRADVVVRHEGELTFTELVLARLGGLELPLEAIEGLCYRDARGEVVSTPDRDYIHDLDLVPPPALDLVPYGRYRNYGRIVKRVPVGVVIGSRGCPYHCIFCFHSVFGKKFRAHSAERVLAEVRDQVERHGVREISFMEDNFTVDHGRVLEICDGLSRLRPRVAWTCNAHANTAVRHPELFHVMRGAGCWLVNIGVETGSERISKLLKKNAKREHLETVFHMARAAGLQTLAYAQVGNYDDDRESVEETVAFLCSLPATFATFNVTTPLPGSELWEMVKGTDLVNGLEDYDRLNVQKTMVGKTLSPLRTAHLDQEELFQLMRGALRRFFLRPRQLARLVGSARTPHQWLYLLHFAMGFLFKREPRCMNADPLVAAEIEQAFHALDQEETPCAP